MSIVQAFIGAVSGSAAPPYYSLYTNNNSNEGSGASLVLYYENIHNQTLYWTISNGTAVSGVDYNSDNGNSGSFSINGQGTTTFVNVSHVADTTTEGSEYYVVSVGTSPGGSDVASINVYINDTSQAPKADFTIEWWSKMDASGSGVYARLFDVGNYPNEKPGISFEGSSTIYLWAGDGGGSRDAVYSADFAKTQWVHWAIVRRNDTGYLYRNGVNLLNSNVLGTTLLNNTTSPLSIGFGSSQYWNGKITGFHWVKGTAKYTGNFVPLKAPTPVISNSKYLLNVVDNNSAFADATSNHTLASTVGTVNFSTDTPWYTTATSVTRSTNTLGGPNNGIYELQFDPSFTDLDVVKNGWTVTNGSWSAVVREDAALVSGAYRVMLYEGASTPPGGTYVFTPPTQTGSLVFNSSYITIAASSDWAPDA